MKTDFESVAHEIVKQAWDRAPHLELENVLRDSITAALKRAYEDGKCQNVLLIADLTLDKVKNMARIKELEAERQAPQSWPTEAESHMGMIVAFHADRFTNMVVYDSAWRNCYHWLRARMTKGKTTI